MKTFIEQGYVRPEISILECEYIICQNSTSTSDFEDGGAMSGEWK